MRKIEQLREELSVGWNSWNNESVLSQVLLPHGLSVNLGFKQQNWIDEKILMNSLIGKKGQNDETVLPGYHSWDGSYSELTIIWQGLEAKVQTAHYKDNLLVLISPITIPKKTTNLIVDSGFLWNSAGTLLKKSSNQIEACYADKSIVIFSTEHHNNDPFTPCKTPHFVLSLSNEVGISTETELSLDEIKRLIAIKRNEFLDSHKKYGSKRETFLALQAGIAWNTIFDPRHKRVIATVGRLWNQEYGGYCLFGWDNFFLANMIALDNKNLAYSSILEHMTSATEEGFIPNDDRGNLSKSFDRSQPPVGSIMVWEIYDRYKDDWLLEEVFEGLVKWNSWWFNSRMNKGLLSFGSHKTKNPFWETNTHNRVAAGYESGMDDSPMYEGVPFNSKQNILELQDVGLNSLVIADCKALVKMAKILKRDPVLKILKQRINLLESNLEKLWNKESEIYLNYRTDIQEFSARISPTCFYPLLSQSASNKQVEGLIKNHFNNPEEFFGEWMLPSISRNDPTFKQQRYWKGSIWPPLNYLVYLGLSKYSLKKEMKILASKSEQLFLNEWKRKKMVCENYSSITGTGDDPELSSDNFHAWGALMGFMALLENENN